MIWRWLRGWIRRMLGLCPICSGPSAMSEKRAKVGVFVLSGFAWSCMRCGWWRVVWEDGRVEEWKP